MSGYDYDSKDFSHDGRFKMPIRWDNSFSVHFVDLIAICAAAQAVVRRQVQVDEVDGVPVLEMQKVLAEDGALRQRAGALLQRELRSRLKTGDFNHDGDHWDWLLTAASPQGRQVADEFVARGTHRHYPGRGGTYYTPAPLSESGYREQLDSVIADTAALLSEAGRHAEANVTEDPILAAEAASNLAAARVAYVSLLQTRYPNRGFA